MARKLVVEIVGDASSLNRSFNQASNGAQKFERDMGKVTRGTVAGTGAFRSFGRSIAFASGGFLGGLGLSAVLTESVKGASDLEQQISKTNVVFGQSAKDVEAWSKTLDESFGLSQRDALTLVSTFGALFAPLGIVGDQAADQSKKLVQLGADLASFYNTDVHDALAAIQSGLVGQARPLRRYGVLLDAARVQQEALNETGKTNAKSLTNQEKVLARVTLLFQDSAQAQGDFARTSDQFAQQVKISQARVANLSDELGENLVPALSQVLSGTNKVIDALKRLPASDKSGREILREHLPRPAGLHGIFDFVFGKAPAAPKIDLSQPIRDVSRAIGQALTLQKNLKKLDDALSPGRRKANEAVRQRTEDLAQLAVDRAGLTKSVTDDIAALRKLNALLERRIKGGHDVIRNESKQVQVELQINDLLAQQAEARKAAREAAAQAAKDARDARQFRLLGFGPGGEDLVPGVKALKKQLGSVADALSGSFLDTRKTRGLLAHIRQVLSGGLGSVSSEVRSKIQQILADLKAQLKQSSVDVTRFQKTASGQFTLAGAHPAGRGVVINGGVHLHGVQNVQQLENELAKRSKQRAHSRRATR